MNNSQTVRLRLERLTKIFQQRGGKGNVVAVDDVSLDIYSGEFVTLLGPSGCGKTTTLRLIAGFEIPNSGQILLDGQDITHQPPNKRDMALVFQNYALFPHMTVYKNVAYGLETRGLPTKVIRERVRDVLALVGLEGLEERRPNQLSGGQQQRVALARCLVMQPRILLFDEPLSNLDAKLRVQMRSEIHALQRRLHITSIYVTHDQTEAMALSDRIVVMNRGRIEQVGTPPEIYRCPSTRFVADFIGRANFLQVAATARQGGTAEFHLLGQTVRAALPLQTTDGLVAMLRPEALMLRDDPSLLQVQVIQTMYLGSEVEYIVQHDDQRLIVVEHDPRNRRIFAEGEQAGITFVPEAVHIIGEDA
jgi:iron(III) transport system ATP-binding protein